MQSSNTKLKIEYDSKSGRFHLIGAKWMNDLIRQIPNRRWDNRRGLWVAPNLRANADYILNTFGTIADISAEARTALESKAGANKQVGKSQFPWHWYRFKTDPIPKQREALDKCYGNESFSLFMGMGTGKTKVVIDLACAWRMDGQIGGVVIIPPLSIRNNWVRELSVHSPLPVDAYLLDASKPKAFRSWLAHRHDFKWLIANIEGLSAGGAGALIEEFLLHTPNALVVSDESWLIKNASSIRTKKCFDLRKKARKAGLMNGTPISKGVEDLYAQYEFLDPDIIGLGDYYSFRNRYCVMGGFDNKQIIGYQNVNELMALVSPHTFIVSKEEAIGLPPKVYQEREVQMLPEQAALYKSMKRDGGITVGDDSLVADNILEKMLRLQEIVAGIVTTEEPISEREEALWAAKGKKAPRKFTKRLVAPPERLPKVAEVMTIANELSTESVIIWSVFIPEIRAMVHTLRAKYGHNSVVEIHGGVDEQERADGVKAFQAKQARWLVANPVVGGAGLTLTAATIEIYMSNSFNFIYREQSEDRAHRKGQDKTVTIIDLIAPKTVDVTTQAALSQKLDVSEFVKKSLHDRQTAESLLGDA